MLKVKITLPVIKLDRSKNRVEKRITFNADAINIADWDLEDAISKNTCKIFLSGATHEVFQIALTRKQLEDKLAAGAGYVFIE